jgi:predicted acyltransferase
MNNKLPGKRIATIDAFRGITILVMVFVNELAGIRDIPAWMKHVPAGADAMTFVDVVFPAFLFIAGMSIPFALGKRLMNNPDRRKLQEHILWRVAGLLCFGFFIVYS